MVPSPSVQKMDLPVQKLVHNMLGDTLLLGRESDALRYRDEHRGARVPRLDFETAWVRQGSHGALGALGPIAPGRLFPMPSLPWSLGPGPGPMPTIPWALGPHRAQRCPYCQKNTAPTAIANKNIPLLLRGR